MNNPDKFTIDLKSIKKQVVSSSEPEVNLKNKEEKLERLLCEESNKADKLFSKSNTKFSLIILALIISLILGISIFLIYRSSETYYQGVWNGEITEIDKQAGVKKVTYEISDTNITQITESDNNGIKVEVKIDYEVSILEKRSAGVYFKLENIELSSINVDVPAQLCGKDISGCDRIKDNYRKTFEEFLDKQKKDLINTNIRFSNSESGSKIVFSNREEIKLKR